MLFLYAGLALLLVIAMRRWLAGQDAAPPARSTENIVKLGGLAAALALLIRLGARRVAHVIGMLTLLAPLLKHWQPRRSGTPDASHSMSREEAAHILDISAQAPKEEIREAHRRMIARNHPDQGGSSYLASKINQARDVLLESHHKS